jgi:hypothetical protein
MGAGWPEAGESTFDGPPPRPIKYSRKLSVLREIDGLRMRNIVPGTSPSVPILPMLRSRAAAKSSCFENRWEYSSENTRFQIDRPKQLEA